MLKSYHYLTTMQEKIVHHISSEGGKPAILIYISALFWVLL